MSDPSTEDRAMGPAEALEGLGSFYLGSMESLRGEAGGGGAFLYDAKDLTTHGVALGMTGSGKTGLCITLLEEAALDGIPTLVIDPKGDIGNLLLTFPDLKPADFRPWIDEGEAARKNRTPDEHAADTAEKWRAGLAASGQDGDRIRRLREAVEMTIYTPGGTHGVPLAVLRSFTAPSEAVRVDADALGDRVTSAVSGLLSLVGDHADPLQSRDHILLSRILYDRWIEGADLDLGGLIRAVQNPGFDRIGVLDLESFFPERERFKLAARLNNLVAAPGFEAWLKGDPLDIGRLLWTADGKPRISILSIAHLNDAERQFFLTMLLNEVVAWMRSQSGSSSLRAILYIDEVFGYLPPTAMPPTKTPLLTLLKQARAFGLGILLATQNPVDLDYKALSNIGTWFLGRLQTERDKKRVLDGLEGSAAMSGSGGLSRRELDVLLSDLDSRVFLVNNVHEHVPVLIRTRWAMSYLRGPLARSEIRRLMAGRMSTHAAEQTPAPVRPLDGIAPAGTEKVRPIVPPQVEEVFIDGGGDGPYRPVLFGHVELHYTKAKTGLDHWVELYCFAPLEDETMSDPWQHAELLDRAPMLSESPTGGVNFATLPAAASKPASYRSWKARFKSWAYKEGALSLRTCKRLKLTSGPDESAAEFTIRVREVARDARDEAVEKLRDKVATKVKRLEDRIDRAEDRVRREEAEYEQVRNQSLITIGGSLLGAVLGRKALSRTNVSKASIAMRGMGRASKQKDDIGRAEDALGSLEADLRVLEDELKSDLVLLREEWDPAGLEFEEVRMLPRKSDIGVKRVVLAWIRD